MRVRPLLVRFCLLASLVLGPQASAQDRLLPGAVADLAASVHLSRDGFMSRLAAVAPHVRARPLPPVRAGDDPFLWRFEGAFGAPRAAAPPARDVPAGLIHCVRFGLATRDDLLAHAASDPEVFPLVSALRIETRDMEVWPPDAIAVLRCSFAWDDARRIAPWAEAEAADVIYPLFNDVRRRDDVTVRAETGAHLGDQYGADGFRLEGRNAEREVYFWLESMIVSRQVSHQRVAFRVYLLSGGV